MSNSRLGEHKETAEDEFLCFRKKQKLWESFWSRAQGFRLCHFYKRSAGLSSISFDKAAATHKKTSRAQDEVQTFGIGAYVAPLEKAFARIRRSPSHLALSISETPKFKKRLEVPRNAPSPNWQWVENIKKNDNVWEFSPTVVQGSGVLTHSGLSTQTFLLVLPVSSLFFHVICLRHRKRHPEIRTQQRLLLRRKAPARRVGCFRSNRDETGS